MISNDFILSIESTLAAKIKPAVKISGLEPLSGGCINNAYRLITSRGNFFLKWNDAGALPGMFEGEAKGLQLLRSTETLFVPGVITTGKSGWKTFLVMEWVESNRRQKNFWEDFGRGMGKLHRVSSEKFGLDHDNYIGSLKQCNHQHTSWSEFFIVERLERQLKLAIDQNKLANSLINQLANLSNRISEIIPGEKPSLVHGDLWNGNYMVSAEGSACLIDPAVYFGHREMDLAMTKLFGGFDAEFYKAYNSTFPLEKGFDSRIEIHNLYPLLVHANLFGGGYIQQVKSILSKF